MHELGFDHVHPSEEEKEQLSTAIWSADNVEFTTVGVDVGSSTSHLMFAKVHLQRLAESMSSRFVVVGREVRRVRVGAAADRRDAANRDRRARVVVERVRVGAAEHIVQARAVLGVG